MSFPFTQYLLFRSVLDQSRSELGTTVLKKNPATPLSSAPPVRPAMGLVHCLSPEMLLDEEELELLLEEELDEEEELQLYDDEEDEELATLKLPFNREALPSSAELVVLATFLPHEANTISIRPKK